MIQDTSCLVTVMVMMRDEYWEVVWEIDGYQDVYIEGTALT